MMALPRFCRIADNWTLPSARFRRAVELRADPNGAYVLGCQLEQLGRFQEALDAFQLATNISPRFSEAHAKIGAFLLNSGKPAEAVRSYRQAVDIRSDVGETYCNLATALFRDGQETKRCKARERRSS